MNNLYASVPYLLVVFAVLIGLVGRYQYRKGRSTAWDDYQLALTVKENSHKKKWEMSAPKTDFNEASDAAKWVKDEPVLPVVVAMAHVLDLVSDISSAIRQHSYYRYKNVFTPSAYAMKDLMYLSDCLHNLNVIAKAIKAGDQDAGIAAIEWHERLFEQYKEIGAGPSFWRAAISLGRCQSVLRSLKLSVATFGL